VDLQHDNIIAQKLRLARGANAMGSTQWNLDEDNK